MFARIAQAAQAKPEEFYQHKLVLAQYYAEKCLPQLASHIAKIQAGTATLMQLPEAYFTAQA